MATSTAPSAPTTRPTLIPRGERRDIPIDRIIDPKGPSDRMPGPEDAAEIAGIAGTMQEYGQFQPILVEELVDGRFCRVFGRRRIAAAKSIGWTTIDARVVPPIDSDVRRAIVAIENLQRKNLSPAEETLGVCHLLGLHALSAARQLGRALSPECGSLSGQVVTPELIQGARKSDKAFDALSHDALLDPRVKALAIQLVAGHISKPASWVKERLYVSRLGTKAQELVRAEKLPLAHARMIARVADPQIREELAKDFAAGGSRAISDTEAGRLDELEGDVTERLFNLSVAPWNPSVPFAGKPACDGCPHNSRNNPGLFEGGGVASDRMVGGRGQGRTREVKESDGSGPKGAEVVAVCTLHTCYATKLIASKGAVAGAAKKMVDGGKSLQEVMRPFISADAVKARAASLRQHRKQNGPAKKPTKAEPDDKELAIRAKQESQAQFDHALGQREEEAIRRVQKALKGDPIRIALVTLIADTKLWSDVSTSYNKTYEKQQQSIRSPGMTAMLKRLKDPKAEDFLAIAKLVDAKECRVLEYDHESMGPALCEALGLDLPPAPKLEDFLPKKEKAPKAEKKPVAKKAKKKGA